MATADAVFTALADPMRRQVLSMVVERGPVSATSLGHSLPVSRQAVVKHLGVLRKVGVVSVIRRGQHRMYRLNAAKLRPVHDWVKTFERYWTHQIGQIKERAERKALERMISSNTIKKED